MKHEDYIAEVEGREPHFAAVQAAARAVLDFGMAIEHRIAELRLTYEEIERSTGLSQERVEAIEEGETPDLAEVVALCRALRLDVTVDHDASITLRPTAMALAGDIQ